MRLFLCLIIALRTYCIAKSKACNAQADDSYNLILYTSPLSLTRQSNDGTFEIIWPEKVSFAIDDSETFNFREGDKLYFNIWYEDPDYREETIEE